MTLPEGKKIIHGLQNALPVPGHPQRSLVSGKNAPPCQDRGFPIDRIGQVAVWRKSGSRFSVAGKDRLTGAGRLPRKERLFPALRTAGERRMNGVAAAHPG